ncbi:DUF3224 domain-containing protein [Nonomuraea sp. NBC_01738]|uniref:DUF3224 domain-containing protein n=1 Tax=Nonomuraea sp. NBC_01738 TaxID=2976003 RepID=UPI002E1303BB|nr:DUF3224 domain-containing protein [Nonomuraea sp. NBC_01738]
MTAPRMTAQGAFDTAGWTPQPPYDDRDDISLGVVTMTKTFHGDLTGTSLVTLLVAATPDTKAYVALERVDCTLDGRKGAFVVAHQATDDDGDQSLTITVVPGSGTGDLRGIRGRMDIHIAQDGAHSYVLDYTL